MSLESKITQDLKTAMKAKDQAGLRTIRAIKSAILLQKTDGSGIALNEELEIKMIQKLIKSRKDSLEIYEKQSRDDLAKKEREEIEILERYLPTQLSADDLKPILQDIITKVGASSMKDMGKVMGMASAQLKGQADGKTISSVVRELLG
ncbi:MAG: GatB/YqeY domain-containing protein [Saprospiraceae bacterium]|nr:GatB/YqeY domain-containing protein [Saprospiraceae bacterium]